MPEEIPYGYCRCGCGNLTTLAKKTSPKRGNKAGQPLKYLPKHNIRPDLRFNIGDRFERLVVKDLDGRYAVCVCDCGTEKKVLRSYLRDSRVRSCGCLSRELASARLYKHGAAREGRVTKTFSIWQGMKDRCNNPRDPKHSNYGGRGITVCDRWLN